MPPNNNNNKPLNEGAGARSIQSQPPTTSVRQDGARETGSRPSHPPKK